MVLKMKTLSQIERNRLWKANNIIKYINVHCHRLYQDINNEPDIVKKSKMSRLLYHWNRRRSRFNRYAHDLSQQLKEEKSKDE